MVWIRAGSWGGVVGAVVGMEMTKVSLLTDICKVKIEGNTLVKPNIKL